MIMAYLSRFALQKDINKMMKIGGYDTKYHTNLQYTDNKLNTYCNIHSLELVI